MVKSVTSPYYLKGDLAVKYSVIVPVYQNQDSIPKLLLNLSLLSEKLNNDLEVIFVIDGSTDKSQDLLTIGCKSMAFRSQIVIHSKNFGSFAAITTGLKYDNSEYSSTYSADCQEPIKLLEKFFKILVEDNVDIVFGQRLERRDKFLSKIFSNIFWKIYRVTIDSDMPRGGVDIFGCTRVFRNELIKLEESRSSLIALAFWLGFERRTVNYSRLEREAGKSTWTFRKKLNYFLDSLFSFTDLPIRALLTGGAIGVILSIVLGLVVLFLRLYGDIKVPGYSPTILLILFFGALNVFGIGLVGSYAWRAYENSKNRPNAVVSKVYRVKD
jgi:glycosyltransferase involved in cell wall biosynthesis